MIKELRGKCVMALNEYNAAITKGDLSAMSRAESALKEAESAYAEQAMKDTFAALRGEANPILSAIKWYSYSVFAHQMVREDGKVVGAKMAIREKQIDLVKLCKFLGISHVWEYKVEKFGNLLCMRAAKELGMSDKDIAKIERLYYMQALSRKEEMGAIPTSNTQICKLLQQVIDAIVCVEGESGKNIYRCNNHDVAYLLMCYTKRNNKKMLTVDVAKNSYVHRIVMDVMHRIVTGKVYGVNYKMERVSDQNDAGEVSAQSDEQKNPAPDVNQEVSAPDQDAAQEVSAVETVRIERAAAQEVSVPEQDAAQEVSQDV